MNCDFTCIYLCHFENVPNEVIHNFVWFFKSEQKNDEEREIKVDKNFNEKMMEEKRNWNCERRLSFICKCCKPTNKMCL